MANEIGVTISFNEYKALVEFKLNSQEEEIKALKCIADDRLDRIVELRTKCGELEKCIEDLTNQLSFYEKGGEAENG